MPLFYIVVVLILVGLALWVIDQIPIDGAIKRIIRVVVIVVVILWLLSFFVGYLPDLGPHYYPHR